LTDEIAQVRRHLNDIPDLVVEASHYLVPGTAPKDPDAHYTKGPRLRLPIVAEVFDLLDDRDKDLDDILLNRFGGERRLGVLPSLGLWVSLAYVELDDMGLNPRDCCESRQHTVVGECGWLNEYADPIVELHPDFPRDIERLWLELRKVCRIRKDYEPTCPVCATATRRWRIEPVYGPEDSVYPAWWRCTGCPKTWVHDAEIQRLAMTQPRMTLRQIATWLELPLRTLHNWRSDGRIQPDSKGRYEVAHVREAARKLGRKIKEENSAMA